MRPTESLIDRIGCTKMIKQAISGPQSHLSNLLSQAVPVEHEATQTYGRKFHTHTKQLQMHLKGKSVVLSS